MQEFHGISPEEGKLDNEKYARECGGLPYFPVPAFLRYEEEEQRADGHRPHDREAVGGSEIGRRTEPEHQRDATDHQRGVDLWDENLAFRARGSVNDLETRKVAELDGLAGQ